MDRAGDRVCSVVYRGIWKRGVVYGVCEAERVWAIRDLPDSFGDIGVVLCGAIGGVRKKSYTENTEVAEKSHKLTFNSQQSTAKRETQQYSQK
jgi:hypothetical protein